MISFVWLLSDLPSHLLAVSDRLAFERRPQMQRCEARAAGKLFCIYMYVCVYIIDIYIYIDIYACIFVTHTAYIYTYIHMSVCMPVSMSKDMHLDFTKPSGLCQAKSRGRRG